MQSTSFLRLKPWAIFKEMLPRYLKDWTISKVASQRIKSWFVFRPRSKIITFVLFMLIFNPHVLQYCSSIEVKQVIHFLIYWTSCKFVHAENCDHAEVTRVIQFRIYSTTHKLIRAANRGQALKSQCYSFYNLFSQRKFICAPNRRQALRIQVPFLLQKYLTSQKFIHAANRGQVLRSEDSFILECNQLSVNLSVQLIVNRSQALRSQGPFRLQFIPLPSNITMQLIIANRRGLNGHESIQLAHKFIRALFVAKLWEPMVIPFRCIYIREADRGQVLRSQRSFVLASVQLQLFSHGCSSLFIIVIGLVFMFSLWCVGWVGGLCAGRVFVCFCVGSSFGTQGEVSWL